VFSLNGLKQTGSNLILFLKKIGRGNYFMKKNLLPFSLRKNDWARNKNTKSTTRASF
jgi:hypothetical protein